MSSLSKNLAKIKAKKEREAKREAKMKAKGKKIKWSKKAYSKYCRESKELSDYTCPKYGIVEHGK